MKSNGALRNWFDSVPVERDSVSWAVSLGVHLALLVLLALVWQHLPDRPTGVMLSSLDAGDALTNLQEVQYSDATSPADEVGGDSLQGASAALPAAPMLDDLARVETRQMPRTEIGTATDVGVIDELSSAPNLNDRITGKGDAGVGVSSAAGAVDQITQRILESLDHGPTLVVWLMDQSGSLQGQRATIEQRFDHIYHELSTLAAQGGDAFTRYGDHPLLTAVVPYGQDVHLPKQQPTDDLVEIKKAIREIPVDESGVELTFTAVIEAAQKYQKLRSGGTRRNIMLIVVTDEAGDDQDKLEAAIDRCQRYAIPVYVIGVPAPFGQQQAFLRYKDPDERYGEQYVPVKQGPESLMTENVQLGFSGGDWDGRSAIDSGFGPYALTRLCVNTKGAYYAVHPNRPAGAGGVNDTAAMATRIRQFFDRTAMQPYKPDYVSAREYAQLLRENKARKQLVLAAQESEESKVELMGRPRLQFPKRSEAGLIQDLEVAQQSAARVAPKLEKLFTILKDGEKDRAKLTEARWQAGYDLAMGRVLAIGVRTNGYNAMLAKARNGMKFEKGDSDTWVLEPSNEITADSKLEKAAAQAREYLTRVRDQHPGTPWAYLAERELVEPFGWKWTERHTIVEEPRRAAQNGGGGGGNPQDQLRKLEKPKPPRENVKL
jgi:hypothetical protein